MIIKALSLRREKGSEPRDSGGRAETVAAKRTVDQFVAAWPVFDKEPETLSGAPARDRNIR